MSYKRIRLPDKTISDDFVIRLADGAVVPITGKTRDTRIYLAWLADGNSPQVADPIPDGTEAEQVATGAKQWYLDHPAAANLFTLSIAELETVITNHVAALFPNATAQQRSNEILWRMTASVELRVLARREGLI